MTAVSIAYAYHLGNWAPLLLTAAVIAVAVWRFRGDRTLRRMADDLADRLGF